MSDLLQKSVVFLAITVALYNILSLCRDLKLVNATPLVPIDPKAKFDQRIDDVAWFVQVSDLHFSIFMDPDRPRDFVDLCSVIKTKINPQAVILTGDLTDAKAKDKLGSRQFEAEWKLYRETVEACGAFDPKGSPLWLDVRGNHDTFNTKGPVDDFYSHYGIRKDFRTYSKSVKFNNKTYAFSAIDATLVPGPKRPFNFFGSLSQAELIEAEQVIKKSAQNSDYQLIFGHYPTSCILSPDPGIRSLLKSSLAYLCGHLHTLNGLAPHMYSSQPGDFLELELGDWKDNRIFRILVVDQGQLSFQDQVFNRTTSPLPKLSVITNPIDMTYVQPQNFELIAKSSHIRALVFDPKVDTVQATIDGHDHFVLKRAQAGFPLFTAEWNPSQYDDGQVHHLTMLENKIQFSLTNSPTLGLAELLSKIVLFFNWSQVTQGAFGCCAALVILPLSFLRSSKSANGKMQKIAKNDALFYAFVLSALYISVGPWALGYFLDESLGLLFPWGLWIDGHILPADVTHLYGLVFIFPYLYMLFGALVIYQKRPSWRYKLISNVIFAIVLILQILHCIEFYLCYGVLATLIGTCGVGRLAFVFYVRKHAHKLLY